MPENEVKDYINKVQKELKKKNLPEELDRGSFDDAISRVLREFPPPYAEKNPDQVIAFMSKLRSHSNINTYTQELEKIFDEAYVKDSNFLHDVISFTVGQLPKTRQSYLESGEKNIASGSTKVKKRKLTLRLAELEDLLEGQFKPIANCLVSIILNKPIKDRTLGACYYELNKGGFENSILFPKKYVKLRNAIGHRNYKFDYDNEIVVFRDEQGMTVLKLKFGDLDSFRQPIMDFGISFYILSAEYLNKFFSNRGALKMV